MNKLLTSTLLLASCLACFAFNPVITHTGNTTTIQVDDPTVDHDIYSTTDLTTPAGNWAYRGRCPANSTFSLTNENSTQVFYIGAITNSTDPSGVPDAYNTLVGSGVQNVVNALMPRAAFRTTWYTITYPTCTIIDVPDPSLLGFQLVYNTFLDMSYMHYFLGGLPQAQYSANPSTISGSYVDTNGLPLGVLNGIDYSSKTWSFSTLPYPSATEVQDYLLSLGLVPSNMTITVIVTDPVNGFYTLTVTDGMTTITTSFGGPQTS